MHGSQKSFLPRFLYDLPMGHDTLLNAPLYQTWSFQDNANDDKFHHPALCALPLISLIRECSEGSALSAEGHVVWLNDAEAAAFIPSFRHKLAASSPVQLRKEINGQSNILILKSGQNHWECRFSLPSPSRVEREFQKTEPTPKCWCMLFFFPPPHSHKDRNLNIYSMTNVPSDRPVDVLRTVRKFFSILKVTQNTLLTAWSQPAQ